MYQETGDKIKLYWYCDDLFKAISDETAYNSRGSEAGDLLVMSNDERRFFDSNISDALALLAAYFRRISHDRDIEILNGREAGLFFIARKNTENQYSNTDLFTLDKSAEKYIKDWILHRWYVSVKEADHAQYYTSQLTMDDASLLDVLFRFYRPVGNGLGYGVTSVKGGCHKPHSHTGHNHAHGCGGSSPGRNPLIGVRKISMYDNNIEVLYTDGKREIIGSVKDGESVYDFAVNNGFPGNEQDFLEYLRGKPFSYDMFTPEQLDGLKIKGDTGMSAYEIALSTGQFTGTLNQYLQSLHGKNGSDGKDGVDTTLKLPQLEIKVESENVGRESKKYLMVRIKGFGLNIKPYLPPNTKIAICRYVYQGGCNSHKNKIKSFKKYVIPTIIRGTKTANLLIEITETLRNGDWQAVKSVEGLAKMFIADRKNEYGEIELVATRRSRKKIIEHESRMGNIQIRAGICLVQTREEEDQYSGNILKTGFVTPFRVSRGFYRRIHSKALDIKNELML